MHLFIDLDKNKDKGIIKSDFLNNIREYFSEEDDKAGLKKRLFKNRFIPSRKYVITPQGRFEIGLLFEIINYLKSLNTPFKIIFSEEFKQRYACSYPFAEKELIQLNLPARPYQIDGVKKGLKIGNGVFLCPTASGKTLLIAMLIQNIRHNQPSTKTLIVTLTHLIDQFYADFISYGINPQDISKWSGENEINTDAKIVICGPNILYNKIENTALEIKKAKIVYLTLQKQLDTDFSLLEDKRKEMQNAINSIKKDIDKLTIRDNENKKIHDFLETFNLLMFDEIHTLKKDNEITNVLKYIPTRHRFGFTGTLPESKIDQWTIYGKIGPLIYEVPRQFLVDEKYIADVEIKVLLLQHKTIVNELDEEILDDDQSDEMSKPYQDELDFIHKSVFRNNIIKKIAEKVNKNCLILVDRIPHGELLLSHLSSIINKKVYFIRGEVENEEREKIRQLMEEQDNIICIAISKIFSTGVNIKNLHYIIFASTGKAKVKIIQSIGRGVRMLEGKTKLIVFDICDILKYSLRHLKKRIELYKNEKINHTITRYTEA